MRILKKTAALLMTVVMSVTFTACADKADNAKNLDIEKNVTVNVWYSDESYSPYIEYVAEKLHEANELLTINSVLIDEQGYMDNVYKSAIDKDNTENAPDVYLINSDDLQKAYLMGITAENDIYASKYTTDIYTQTAINACTYNGKLYGYPISFNTSIMVYNKKYVSQPDTFTQITDYSNSYKVDDNNKDVQFIITWDTSNDFLNYGFGAPYLNIGGAYADDNSILEVNNTRLKEAMTEFYNLKGAYAIDSITDENYCIDKFKNGNIIYTIIQSEKLSELDNSDVDYGVCKIPDFNSNVQTSSLSQTTMAVVNPYTTSQETAKTVAQALSYDYATDMYNYCNKPSARNDTKFSKHEESYKNLYSVYDNSVIKAKFIGADEIYLRYELMIKKIWSGTLVNDVVNEFENMIKQVK